MEEPGWMEMTAKLAREWVDIIFVIISASNLAENMGNKS